jgi:ubiquinone/menaquinone biosynthesis C-methylase UbiE
MLTPNVPVPFDVPDSLTAIRKLNGNAVLSRWEREVTAFMQPHYQTFSPFPRYFRTQGLNFQLLRQLLPEYFQQRYPMILEVGCGTGFQSLLLSPHAERMLGIDIPGEYAGYVMPSFKCSTDMASFLVNRCFGVDWTEFKDAFPDSVPLDDTSVDLVYSWTVLEHVPSLPPMFAEMARVVKQDGLMIHVVPSIMSALDTLVKANISHSLNRPQHRISLRDWLKAKVIQHWVIPELHSEFLRGKATYNDQLNLYLTDSYVHPMMEAGFSIEKLLWLRDYNVAIVARKM